MVNITEIPPELLTHLFSFLPGQDLGNVCQVCKRFRDAVNVETLWQKRCRYDYSVSIPKKLNDIEEVNYKDLYTKLLWKYGHLLGVWYIQRPVYGGILHIKFVDNSLLGMELSAPVDPHVVHPLRVKNIFRVQLSPNLGCQAVCVLENTEPHPCDIECQNENNATCKCLMRTKHSHDDNPQQHFVEWFKEETNHSMEAVMVYGHDLLYMKYKGLQDCVGDYPLHRLSLPPPITQPYVPVQPGLFKGNYGSHGIELILFTYNLEKNEIQGHKVTGDPNIPAGKLSIKADLSQPLILNLDQQENIDFLREISLPDVSPGIGIDQLPMQPFQIPDGCFERALNPPTQCKARFNGQGQIAAHGYGSPTMSPLHWIVFDENTLAVLWIDLRCFAMFSRVFEDLDAPFKPKEAPVFPPDEVKC